MSNMSDLFQTSAESITLALKGARDAFDHAGVKGDAAEESVRSFLRSRLPASVGMTRGQVVDSHGAMSRQVDVILYDAMRTPMLFESPEQGHHLVPVEGVLAAIEVKAHLTKPLLESIVENCRSVKSLQKQAYLGPPQRKYNIYEQEWDDFPIYYTVFAFEADNLYAEPLNDLMRDLELHVRVDSVCCLDRGVNLNSSFTGQITNPMGFSPTPTRFGGLCDISTPNALLLWFVTLSTMVF